VILQVIDVARAAGFVGLDIEHVGLAFVIVIVEGIWILMLAPNVKLFHVINVNVSDVVADTILLPAAIVTFLNMFGWGVIVKVPEAIPNPLLEIDRLIDRGDVSIRQLTGKFENYRAAPFEI